MCKDGEGIADATMCGTNNCATCECPKAELANTEGTYPLRTDSVRNKVEEQQAERLRAYGTIKDDHKDKVCYTGCILLVI